jgi:two-component system chemotaxis response regulator CheY
MKSVLWVDDSKVVREIAKKELLARGYAVHEAADGYEAIELYREHRPDLVVMDIVMPRMMDGIQASEHILSLDPSAKIVIYTSKEPEPRDAEKARALGIKDYLVKPRKIPLVVDKIEQFL